MSFPCLTSCHVPGGGHLLCLPLFPLVRLLLHYVLEHEDITDLKSFQLQTEKILFPSSSCIPGLMEALEITARTPLHKVPP